ncbi:MAG: glycoside hydrolase family 3 C-terminal domain-containing protein [Oscillospiraceae bacterium]|jgi:beta-glucosidase|nr:glycoside hydrolase family 3 C-terminal domain-containing protein [Oscillospiraceae bacterium]
MSKAKRGNRKKHPIRKVVALGLTLVLLLFIGYQLVPVVQNLSVVRSFRFATETPEAVAARAEAAKVAEAISDEGIVLLENDGLLPLQEKKLNVFGAASFTIRYGGSGAGASNAVGAIDLYQGLTQAGIAYNEDLHNITAPHAEEGAGGSLFSVAKQMLLGKETEEPDDSYLTQEVLKDAAAYADTALIVFSSSAVEASDALPEELQLSEAKRQLLAKVCGAQENVILVINAGNPMELGFIKEYPQIKAVLWMGTPGPYGCRSLGKILAGEVNPSGHLTDTWAYDITSAPAAENFGDYDYTNIKGMALMEYEEGIYVGYRYYETRYADDFEGYTAAVQYPFGYGLSYTSFGFYDFTATIEGTAVKTSVTVTNTGKVPGKAVPQIYFSAPWTQDQPEKSAIVLAAYTKTKTLSPGESETIYMEYPVRNMASWDTNAGAYALDGGEYVVYCRENIHSVARNGCAKALRIAEQVYTADETTGTALQNRFAYAEDGLTYLSRADWEGTYPTDRDVHNTASAKLLAAHEEEPAVSDEAVPATGADNGLKLADMKSLAYDDPQWEPFLDQFTVKEMQSIVSQGAYRVNPVARLGLAQEIMLDGPAGFSSMLTSLNAAAYPTEIVVASTWNDKLAQQLGEAVGTEANAYGVSVWYAPGMNLHRTARGGRNFEYFSEDPLLSGKMAAAMVRGAQSKHLIVTVKHFVLNEQEVNARSGIFEWVSEQALRELYLRPFEIAVKEAAPTGVMSSFIHIGHKWSGGNPELLTDVLRGEWGFCGFVTSDAALRSYMDVNKMLHAGNDLLLDALATRADAAYWKQLLKDDEAGTVAGLRQAVHNVCYALANR